MKAILKIGLILSLLFASTFIMIKSSGVMTIEDIEYALNQAQSASPWLVASIIIALLFADLFIAVPTLTICILAGYFLGPTVGAAAAISGITLAGIAGYLLSIRYGDKVLAKLIPNAKERANAKSDFIEYGTVSLLLSRALPILPETSACLAGLCQMKFKRFISCWLISAVPYSILASYAGSISNVSNPKPAIFTAIGLTSFFWLAWWVFTWQKKNKQTAIKIKKA
ncbi:VTT domain-containing protein [Catenovulum sp. SM1970]|uniref:TVP38/TMEM64 family protein n=1 Tax=Marinifaba aquimaris TaxID=2741323 RepID=UPI00157163E1|nr:VTT domain-containing protein [Marinifaba aquimaris]NTS78257.1 VTT domain-containing protein [Marinifaba aquimaris]